MNIKIEWLSDEHDCENCGTVYAEGAIVTFGDGTELKLLPVATCYGGEDYTLDDVYQAIMHKLGHEIEIVN